jgi:hypothetical protein
VEPYLIKVINIHSETIRKVKTIDNFRTSRF